MKNEHEDLEPLYLVCRHCFSDDVESGTYEPELGELVMCRCCGDEFVVAASDFYTYDEIYGD